MKNRVTGTVERRKRLSPEQLLSVELPIPSLEAQQMTSKALDRVRELVDATKAELAALRAVRADLLSGVLSQEMTVDAAVDKFVKAA